MTPRVRQYAHDAGLLHGLPASAVMTGTSRREARARGEVMQRLRAEGFKTTQIGRWFRRDHSTVAYWTGERK